MWILARSGRAFVRIRHSLGVPRSFPSSRHAADALSGSHIFRPTRYVFRAWPILALDHWWSPPIVKRDCPRPSVRLPFHPLPRALFRSGRGEGAMKMSGAGAVARLSSIFGDRFGSRAAGPVEGTGLVLPNWVPVHSWTVWREWTFLPPQPWWCYCSCSGCAGRSRGSVQVGDGLCPGKCSCP